MIIRQANKNDASAILDIYKPYIENTSFTFETEVPDLVDFQKRIDGNLENWPWLVCEDNGKITGYAYGSKHRERKGYQWCVESSIYIHDVYLQRGVGKVLYETLLEILKKQGYRNVYAVINLPNDRSVKFHEKCGFSFFAMYPNVGYKLGKWKNVGWWQKILNEYNSEPDPPSKFSEMNKEILGKLFIEKAQLIQP
ncbi:MAG TPA: GNAT family N-acetyltransferase [Chitinophagaceae bacterium]|nr:GNAT family N-acetyltransferase [Chitinophagaceae bacterium]